MLQAFGQVADALNALQHDAETIEADQAALDTALFFSLPAATSRTSGDREDLRPSLPRVTGLIWRPHGYSNLIPVNTTRMKALIGAPAALPERHK